MFVTYFVKYFVKHFVMYFVKCFVSGLSMSCQQGDQSPCNGRSAGLACRLMSGTRRPDSRQWPVSQAVDQILAVAGQPGCPVSQVARALRRSVSQESRSWQWPVSKGARVLRRSVSQAVWKSRTR